MPKRRRGLILPVLAIGFFVALAVALSSLRGDDAQGPAAQASGLTSVLYGNDMSDLRDFARIISGLYGGFYLGQTYLAGYLSFIPSAWSDFRYDMAFGRVSPLLAGLDPELHNGLRPPLLGELYVNFAWPGVIIGGAIFGILVGHILRWVGCALSEDRCRMRYSPNVAVWTGFLAYQLATSLIFTPAFFDNYIIVALLALGAFVRSVAQRGILICP